MNVPWRKIRLLLADFGRVNVRYWRDTDARNRLREVLKRDGLTPSQHVVVAAEAQAAPREARPFSGLSSTSLTLAGVAVSESVPRRLNLVIGEVSEGGVYAGIHTALTVARSLSTTLGIPIRIVMVNFTSPGNNAERARRFVAEEFGLPDVAVVAREHLRDHAFGTTDVWLATHWKTAHAVQVAVTAGKIDRARVIYLIQDYEPGFSPWSSESVLARATYHAGFAPLVNSIPLWSYLCAEEGLEIDRAQVFAPSFEIDRLRETADGRTLGNEVTVLFYGRPTKHRNLFQVGLAALRVSVLQLGTDAPKVRFYSAGEAHDPVDLGSGHELVSLGRMPWKEYFEFLSRTQVLLSLQQSPHPSHPPFDAAISGATAVTNDFHGTRSALHPRIIAVEATPDHLGSAVTTAIHAASTAPPSGFLPVAPGLLGAELDDAISAVLAVRDLA